MAVTHTAATRNSIADQVGSLANVGAQTTLKIYTAGDVELVSIDIPDFGSAAGGVITSAASGNSGTAGATGTASYGAIEDGAGLETFRGACGVGSGEIQLNSLSIANLDLVTLTANITYTAPV